MFSKGSATPTSVANPFFDRGGYMRILFINSVCGIRSTGRIVTELAEKFIASGNECMIAYGREAVPEKYKNISYRIGTDLNVKINALNTRLFDNDGFCAKNETKKFIEWANNYNPDVLWLHNLHGYYINIEMLFDWIKTRPNMQVKWTLHDCWAFTGHCSYFSMANCNKWKSQCEKCIQKKEYPSSFLKDNSFNNFQRKRIAFTGVKHMTIITPSKWLANLVGESFLQEYEVEVHYNTIDNTIFKPTASDFREQHNLQNKTVILGVASTWHERKGLMDFIKLEKMLDDKYYFVLVGVDDKQKNMLSNRFITIEKTNSAEELAKIYTAADVFLNLTYEDNYPTVNLESQACGTPCITYRTGGSVESVSPELVVEQGDLNALVLKLQELGKKKI